MQSKESNIPKSASLCEYSLIFSLSHCIHTVPYVQVNKKTFQCDFFIVPCTKYDAGNLPVRKFEVDNDGVMCYKGTLEADLSKDASHKGTFKTAHPGTVSFKDTVDPDLFPSGKVCVKQVFDKLPDGSIVRLKGRHELERLSVECNCLIWASLLLDFTYQFINREVEGRGGLSRPIPELRFTRSMIAIVRESTMEKAFLIEEWLDPDDGECPFVKYLGNRFLEPCVPLTAPPRTHEIAEFLSFAQHIQWQKTGGLAFTSDYQGAGGVLTDPEITSNP